MIGHPPAVVAALYEGKHDAAETESHEHEARQVEAWPGFLIPRFADVGERAGNRQEADRQVDEEGPAPAQVGRQPAAEQGPECGHATDGRAPYTEGDGAVAPLEVGVEDRLRCRQDHRAAHALKDSRGDQHLPAGRDARQHGRGDEDTEAGQVESAPAPDVADAAERDQEGGEDQGVCGVDPFRRRRVDLQVADDRRYGDVHDRGVDDDHGHAKAEHRQAEPAAAAGVAHPVTATFGRPVRHEHLLQSRNY